MSSKSKFLMVFDFDHTVVEENTDSVVQSAGGVGPLPKEIRAVAKEKGWTAFMQAVFNYLHTQSVSDTQYYEKLDAMAFVDGMEGCLRGIRDLGGEIIIISDSNTVFIDRILAHSGLKDVFAKVFTNPAKFEADGRLSIRPFHENKDCDLSGSNLCKGRVLADYLAKRKAEEEAFDFVGYVGDGTNDFCPMLSLSSSGVAFTREGDRFSISSEIERRAKEGKVFKAKRVNWKTGEDILKGVKERLNEAKN